MVSTRSVRHKFSEGEKVLCYEPDPQKTKVLYNSKVLGVGVRKDAQGKKVVQFLIHFQGWNSTWDRFVTEDFILKDTEENRKLQKELAEKAQLTARGFRVRRLSVASKKTVKEEAVEVNSPVKRGSNLYRRGRKKSRTGSENEKQEEESDSEGETGGPAIQTSFSPGLQAILDHDNVCITKENRLLKLPCSPTAVEILELFTKEYTISQIKLMCHRRGHLRPTAGKNAHITVDEICSRANLCREMADGLRVYLDFMTEPALIYKNERAQFKLHTNMPRILHPKVKKEVEDPEEANAKQSSPMRETDRRKSLRSHTDSSQQAAPSQPPVASSSSASEPKLVPPPPPLPPLTKAEANNTHISVDLASLLGHNVVKGGEHLMLRPMSNRDRDILRKLVHKKLVPDWFLRQQPSESNPVPPCLIYGAIHLARALVKIPEIFPHSEHSEAKMNIITDFLNKFTTFLEEHPEWFGDHAYYDNEDSSTSG